MRSCSFPRIPPSDSLAVCVAFCSLCSTLFVGHSIGGRSAVFWAFRPPDEFEFRRTRRTGPAPSVPRLVRAAFGSPPSVR